MQEAYQADLGTYLKLSNVDNIEPRALACKQDICSRIRSGSPLGGYIRLYPRGLNLALRVRITSGSPLAH